MIESRKCPGREATAPSDSDRTGARLSKGHQTGPTEPACEQPHAGDVWEMRPHSATDCTGREAEPLAAYRAQQKADKATRHATYKEREARLVSAMREATGLPFTGLDAVGGMWISLDAAEDYLSPPAKGTTPEEAS